jgi:hypothetical protein
VGTECGYVHTMVSNQCLRLLHSCCVTQVVVCFSVLPLKMKFGPI